MNKMLSIHLFQCYPNFTSSFMQSQLQIINEDPLLSVLLNDTQLEYATDKDLKDLKPTLLESKAQAPNNSAWGTVTERHNQRVKMLTCA